MHPFFRFAVSLVALVVAVGFTTGIAHAKNDLVVNAAPSFVGGASAGRSISLASLRGKPVVLLIAPSPRDWTFRQQLGQLRGNYERLAAQGILCFVAFTSEGGRIRSNIPFIQVNDPSGTAAAYDIQQGFAIAVIGRDGNLDCLSTKPLPAYRLLDLMMNNAAMQEQLRR